MGKNWLEIDKIAQNLSKIEKKLREIEKKSGKKLMRKKWIRKWWDIVKQRQKKQKNCEKNRQKREKIGNL